MPWRITDLRRAMFVPMDGNPGRPPVGTKPAGALDHGAEDGLREELAREQPGPEPGEIGGVGVGVWGDAG